LKGNCYYIDSQVNDENTIIYDCVPLKTFKSKLDEHKNSFESSYNRLSIEKSKDDLLKKLLAQYSLSNHLNELRTYISFTQNTFNDYKTEIYQNDLLSNFQSEKFDQEPFLNFLESYLENEERMELHSVNFKFEKKETLTVRNFFVIKTILDSICAGLDLNLNNFAERKEQILLNRNDFKFSKGDEYVKTEIINSLYRFLLGEKFNQTKALRFIGVFLHLSNIRSNNNEEKELLDTLDSNLQIIDVNNLRQYIKRPPNFYI
jgi:hypothetical protein